MKEDSDQKERCNKKAEGKFGFFEDCQSDTTSKKAKKRSLYKQNIFCSSKLQCGYKQLKFLKAAAIILPINCYVRFIPFSSYPKHLFATLNILPYISYFFNVFNLEFPQNSLHQINLRKLKHYYIDILLILDYYDTITVW